MSLIRICGVLLLFFILPQGECFTCYECGLRDSGCNDPADTTVLKQYEAKCTSEKNVCIKVMMTDEYRVAFRSCGTTDECKAYAECYSCTGDVCNSTNIASISIALLSSGLLFLIKCS